MIAKINGADPLFIAGSVYLASTASIWWVAVIPFVIAGWFFNPRWSRKTGWRFTHDQ